MRRIGSSPIEFMIRILVVSAGLVVLANLLVSAFDVHLGLVLFILGIVCMGIGNLLSLPARRYERRSGIRHINLFKLPTPEEYLAGNLFVAGHPASFYSFENAMLFSGFVTVIIGLVILF